MEFFNLIRTERSKLYKTPSEFYRNAKLSCSYFHYTKIENGKFPDINLAIEILKALNINVKNGIYTLLRSQIKDKESRAIFSNPEESDLKGFENTVNLDQSFIINPSQVNLLKSDPRYIDLALFLSCNLHKKYTLTEISDLLQIPFKECETILLALKNIGIIYEHKGKYWTKNWLYTPDEEIFSQLKETVIKHAFENHLKVDKKEKWNKTLVFNINESSKSVIEEMLENLSRSIVALSDGSNKAKAINVGMFLSWRSFGSN